MPTLAVPPARVNVPSSDVHSLALEILAEHQEHRETLLKLFADTRRVSRGLGYGGLTDLQSRLNRGTDHDGIRGLDDVAQCVRTRHAHLFAGHDDAEARLFDLLSQGLPAAMSLEEAHELALDQIGAVAGPERYEEQDVLAKQLRSHEADEPFLHHLGRRWLAGDKIAALAAEAGMFWNTLHVKLTKLGYPAQNERR